MHKELFSAVAIALTFAIFIPYIRAIARGKTKPHVFSWIIWAIGTLVVFFAQLADGAGVGAWPIGISACITFYIAHLAYRKRGDASITRSDWLFLLAALSTLPIWFITSNPLWAVVVLTLVDIIGFGPTVRRSYANPYDESVSFFALASVRNLLVVLALEHYSMTTVLFPAAVGAACVMLTAFLLYRRKCTGGLRRKTFYTP